MKLEEKINYFKSLDLSKLPEAVKEGVMSQVEMFDEFGAEEMEGDAETVVLVDDLYKSVRKYVGDSPAQAQTKAKSQVQVGKYKSNARTLSQKKSGVRTSNQNRAKSKQKTEDVSLPTAKKTPKAAPAKTKTEKVKSEKANSKEVADKKASAAKAKEDAKVAKKKATEAQKKSAKAEKVKLEKGALKEELKTLQAKAKNYAKLEEVLAKRLTDYIEQKFPQGLGATEGDKDLEALRMKVKFYRALLAKDKADYKALCVMLGIDYKITSPRAKKTGVAGLGKAKKKKVVRVKKEPSFIDRVKSIFS